ncbi:MAG: AMP-binding protein [Myxococcales bacterium]|nr:AMP-binding protein [Myxococcales bacterium]
MSRNGSPPTTLTRPTNAVPARGSLAPPSPDLPPLDCARVFEGSNLVVLGGTGFLGKVFWVMLLAAYPGIGKIYMMVRSSKGKGSPEQRFWKEVATNECLRPLREQHGEGFEAFLREKIVPIDGDVGKPNCGVDPALIAELKGTVDAVVNVAGVVDFTPPLDEALDANAFGAQNLVALSRALGDAPLFHTSTCYTAGTRKGLILEQDPLQVPFPRHEELGAELWDPDREIADCLDLIAQAHHRCNDAFRQSEFKEKALSNLLDRGEPTEGPSFDAELEKVRRKYVESRLQEAGMERATHWGWQNTYTYTKSIGEQVIARSGLPFTIVRPACCESTSVFPFPGWNEGISTSVPIIFLTMQGQVRIPASKAILDFIPSDMVCAGMVLALAELLEGNFKPVYQLGASDVNPCTSYRFGELFGLYKRKHYQRTGKGNPFVNLLKAYTEILVVDKHHFRKWGSSYNAKAMRTVAQMMKRVPVLKPGAKALEGVAKVEDKIAEIMELFVPFMHEQVGPFSCANTRAAYTRATDADKAKLPWRPDQIDWNDWTMNIHMPAVEKWVFPDMEAKLKKEPKPLKAHTTLVTMLHEMASRHDLSVALSRLEADGLSRVTYQDLEQRAEATAARLAEMGVEKGARVVLSAKNHPDWAVAYFGILRAGATVVPVDPAMDPEGFANIVHESGARVVVRDVEVDEKVGDRLRKVEPPLRTPDLHALTAEDRSLVPPTIELSDADVASLIYTSGTTGHPKGVQLTHANFTALVASLAPIFPLHGGDRLLSVLPLHHTFEFTCGLLLPLSRGARILYLDELNGERIKKGLTDGRITAMIGVPALWQLLERRILAKVKDRGPMAETAFDLAGQLNRWSSKTLGLDLGRVLFGQVHDELGGHLRFMVSGGAALPADTQKTFARLGLHLTEGYGLTEAAPVLTVSKPSGGPLGQVGTAIPGVEVKILEPNELGVGEVVARGPNVMKGYTDESATREVIDDKGWLHTGDLGKLDKKGRLSIVGRVKDVIVAASGENVYPDDVENRLGTVQHIEELAIVGVDDPRGGERVACLAVPAKDDEVDRAARMDRAHRSLREALGKLPYGMQPAVVHLYDAPLPRTATRKVKRREVQAMLGRMIAATAKPADETSDATPVRTAISAVTGRPLKEIHPHSTLQDELGFDSLTLTELLVALEARYGTIDPQGLVHARTVEDVEKLLEGRHARAESRTRTIEGRRHDKHGEDDKIDLPKPVQELGKSLFGKLQMGFYDRVMKPTVTGRAFIPYNRPTIVVCNHSSHLDMGFVKYALGSYGQGLVSLAAQDYFFEGNKLTRTWFENFTNLAPLDRKQLRAAMRQAGEILRRGNTVLIFPEGTRSTDGEIQEFKSLVGWLAIEHDVDILPVWLGGTFEALRKGAMVPTQRELEARIGPPFAVSDMRRLTPGMNTSEAAREVARLARQAVLALRDGDVLDFARLEGSVKVERKHPLIALFEELEQKFKPGSVSQPVSFYFTLGNDEIAKWTVKVDPSTCQIKNGKPEGGSADCVLKTSQEIFTKMVRDAYIPGPAEVMSGLVKSNDVGLLFEFQKAFQLV